MGPGCAKANGGGSGERNPDPFIRPVVRSTSPVSLSSNREDVVTWPVWGGAFTLDETVLVRVAVQAAGTSGAGLVLAGPGGPEGRNHIALAWTGTGWSLQETDDGGIVQDVPLATSPGIELVLKLAPGGESLKVTGAGGDPRLVPLSPLAVPGEELGLYVRLEPGAGLELEEISLSQALPVATALGTPLRELAAARGLSVGTATDVWPPVHDLHFEALLGEQFDLAAPTELYWTSTRGEDADYFFVPADLMVNYAAVHGQSLTGMFLVWDFELPAWLVELAATDGAEAVGDALDEHIETTVTRYRGRMDAWVVVNEAIWGPEESGGAAAGYADSLWHDALGPDYIERAFHAARAADADAVLLYNETGAEALGPKSDFLYAMAADFVERDVPIDGIGLQFHVDAAAPPDMAEVQSNMERIAALGLDVYITELDVSLAQTTLPESEALELQAELYVEVLDACLAVPACRSYTVFGFSDRHAWDELGDASPLIFDESYEAKPAFHAIQSRLSED